MEEKPVILFDGICNFCNRWVNFAIRNDKERLLKFAPLQSAAGAQLKSAYQLPDNIDTLILIDKGKAYTYSDAALRIMGYLNWPAKILYAGLIIPGFIRNPIYRWIARNRYKWFGRKETCMIPKAEVRSRFLD